MNIENELGKKKWNEMFSDAKQKRTVVLAVAGNVIIRHTFQQTLLDVCSTMKRATRDYLFESLEYGMMLSKVFSLKVY